MPPHAADLPDLPDMPILNYAQAACPHCGVIAAWPTATRTLRAYATLAGALGYWPTITSGYRCPWYNATVAGAAADSTHMAGLALDLDAPDTTRQHILDLAGRAGFTWTRANPEKGYVHCDTR